MSERHHALWLELHARLHKRGELPLGYERLTPAEIAAAVRGDTDDERAQRFVWQYYYPRFYGHIAGAMSDAQAAALLASYDEPDRDPPPGAPASMSTSSGRNAAPATARKLRCTICGHRPVRGDAP